MTREKKVGLFVTIGMVVAGALTFVVGDQRRMFDKHVRLNTTFDDVAGLKPGAPVRMGGVDVGTVEKVNFGTDLNDKRLHVGFDVIADAVDRVRADSTVTISNKGLLGDKMLEITEGSQSEKKIDQGGSVTSIPPEDFGKYLTKAGTMLESTDKILANIEKITGSAADPKVAENVKASIAAVTKLLGEAASNDGFVHRLLTDPKLADHLDAMFVDGSKAANGFERLATQTAALVRDAKDGTGIVHEVLYGKDAPQILANVSKISDELALSMKEVRTGKGAAHELLYGDSGARIASDVASMTSDFRKIVSDIKAGKGTIGGFLVDPSIYEDVKSIVGQLEDNQTLRALVRFTIKQDEKKGTPTIKAPAAAGTP
jgi:phospholipid/cholesterol/gamma-HCH transport system substrate-binding protein